MKNYQIIGKIQQATAACRNGLNTAANQLETFGNKLVVKRIAMLDRELEYLRSKTSKQL